VIAAAGTASYWPLRHPLPDQNAVLIEQYLQEFRLRLGPLLSTALFPRRCGLPKRSESRRRQISRTIRLRNGTQIPAHLLRICRSRSSSAPSAALELHSWCSLTIDEAHDAI
jgi:hypothetical protein